MTPMGIGPPSKHSSIRQQEPVKAMVLKESIYENFANFSSDEANEKSF